MAWDGMEAVPWKKEALKSERLKRPAPRPPSLRHSASQLWLWGPRSANHVGCICERQRYLAQACQVIKCPLPTAHCHCSLLHLTSSTSPHLTTTAASRPQPVSHNWPTPDAVSAWLYLRITTKLCPLLLFAAVQIFEPGLLGWDSRHQTRRRCDHCWGLRRISAKIVRDREEWSIVADRLDGEMKQWVVTVVVVWTVESLQ